MNKKHPSKEIREALKYAEKHGWTIKNSNGHAWGIMYCSKNDNNCRGGEYCKTSIWSTPKNTSNFAKQLIRIVNNCIYTEPGDD